MGSQLLLSQGIMHASAKAVCSIFPADVSLTFLNYLPWEYSDNCYVMGMNDWFFFPHLVPEELSL